MYKCTKDWTLLGNNCNVENVRFTTVKRWFSQKEDSILYHLHVRVSDNLDQLRLRFVTNNYCNLERVILAVIERWEQVSFSKKPQVFLIWNFARFGKFKNKACAPAGVLRAFYYARNACVHTYVKIEVESWLRSAWKRCFEGKIGGADDVLRTIIRG